MKARNFFLALALWITAGAPTANAQVQLKSLLTTNKLGNFPLSMAWTGMEKATIRTGNFEKIQAGKEADPWLRYETNRWFRFNLVQNQDWGGNVIVRSICESNGAHPIGGHFYRPSLPSDNALAGVHDDSSIAPLLGLYTNPFNDETNQSGSFGRGFGCGFFTLGPSNSIETVYVYFGKNRAGPKIDSILVKRGYFYPEKK